jgi:hypothetical protein
MKGHAGFRVALVSATVLAGVMGTAISPVGANALSANPEFDQLSCTHFSGKWTFNPALTFSPGFNVQLTQVGKFTGCNASGPVAVKVHHGTVSAGTNTRIYSFGSCGDLEGANFTLFFQPKWKTSPKSSSPSSSIVESQVAVVISPNVTVSSTGTPAVAGDFQGSDGGAASAFQFNSSLSSSAFQTACESSTGLTSLSFTSGNLSLG